MGSYDERDEQRLVVFLNRLTPIIFPWKHAGFLPSGSPPSLAHVPFQTEVICLVYM